MLSSHNKTTYAHNRNPIRCSHIVEKLFLIVSGIQSDTFHLVCMHMRQKSLVRVIFSCQLTHILMPSPSMYQEDSQVFFACGLCQILKILVQHTFSKWRISAVNSNVQSHFSRLTNTTSRFCFLIHTLSGDLRFFCGTQMERALGYVVKVLGKYFEMVSPGFVPQGVTLAIT